MKLSTMQRILLFLTAATMAYAIFNVPMLGGTSKYGERHMGFANLLDVPSSRKTVNVHLLSLELATILIVGLLLTVAFKPLEGESFLVDKDRRTIQDYAKAQREKATEEMGAIEKHWQENLGRSIEDLRKKAKWLNMFE